MRVIIIMLLLTAPIISQTVGEQVTIKEVLPDGSFITESNGKEYRAISSEQMRKIQIIKSERDSYRTQTDQLSEKIVELKETTEKLLAVKQKQFDLRENQLNSQLEFWKSEYEKERKLTDNLSGYVNKCSFRFLGLRVCWGF